MRYSVILVLTLGTIFTLGSRAAAAAPAGDVMATVRGFVNAFNRGDVKGAVATCASPASIIDEFPPHEWQGATACADWFRAAAADDAKQGITGAVVTLHRPWHVNVTGDRAYVVVPADYRYEQRGKPMMETGSIFTVALRRTAAGWRITGWAWARH